jgi:hypothetical protein
VRETHNAVSSRTWLKAREAFEAALKMLKETT